MLRSTFSLPPRPVPVDAFVDFGITTLTVVFDRPLRTAAGLDLDNWYLQVSSTIPTITGVSTTGNTAIATLGVAAGGPPGDWCSYRPPPFDIIGNLGQIVQPFEQYPVHFS